ncbi:hypothetical protein THAOC_37241, partial [Thalassiosira oceanica]
MPPSDGAVDPTRAPSDRAAAEARRRDPGRILRRLRIPIPPFLLSVFVAGRPARVAANVSRRCFVVDPSPRRRVTSCMVYGLASKQPK